MNAQQNIEYPSVSVENADSELRSVLKTVMTTPEAAPEMTESTADKPADQDLQPRYDFVGIAG